MWTMPQCKQPKCLFEICVEYAAVKIDDILKYEASLCHRSSSHCMKLKELPMSLYHAVLNKILSNGTLQDGNYPKILGDKTRDLLIDDEGDYNINQAEFLKFLQENCKNIVKIDLAPLLSTKRRVAEKYENILIGETLASMLQLEWVNLKGCAVNYDCLELIGSNCTNLKHLNLDLCESITCHGIGALCDPGMGPYYGMCTELTHLSIRSGVLNEPLIWNAKRLSFVLLHCPNLQHFDYEFSARALHYAIKALNVPARAEGLDNSGLPDLNFDPQRVFKLETIEFDSSYDFTFEGPLLFLAVQKHCPNLENLVLVSRNFGVGDLRGVFAFRLQSITVCEFDSDGQEYVDPELFLLFRSVGNTLTTLCLRQMCVFDLRVICRECPNLTTLSLISCSTIRMNASWPGYPLDELRNCVFNSLTKLVLSSTSISSVNFEDILSSPNLQSLELGGYTSRTMFLPPIINQMTIRFPNAFRKLQSLALRYVEMDKYTLNLILNRATVLNDLTVLYCCVYTHGKEQAFDEERYLSKLIKDNNWELHCKWYSIIYDASDLEGDSDDNDDEERGLRFVDEDVPKNDKWFDDESDSD